ncbi:MAG TPA: flagellar protein FlaG [Fontimonas sp.]
MMPTLPAVSALVAPQGSGHSGVLPDPQPRHDPVPPGAAATADGASENTAAELATALPWLREAAEQAGVDLTFRIEQDLGRVVVTVSDRRDGTVVRQIPSEEALRIAKHLQKNGTAAGGLLAVAG